MRENEGFQIIASVPVSSNTEIVIGHKETSFGSEFVCWYATNRNDYYWGKYADSYAEALFYMRNRIDDYLGYEYEIRTEN